jgi:hypothetical protein
VVKGFYTFHDTYFNKPEQIYRHWAYVKKGGHILYSGRSMPTPPYYSAFRDVVPPALCYAMILRCRGECGECPTYVDVCPIAAMFTSKEGIYSSWRKDS